MVSEGREGGKEGGREGQRRKEVGEEEKLAELAHLVCSLCLYRGWPMTLVVMSSLESSNLSNWKHCLNV